MELRDLDKWLDDNYETFKKLPLPIGVTYLLTNETTGEQYVGYTRDRKGLPQRLVNHRSRANKGRHSHLPLYASIAEHSWDAFSSEVLAYGNKERHYIQLLQPALNLTDGGIGGCGPISNTCRQATSKANSKPVVCVETGIVYSSCVEAETMTGCGKRTIAQALRKGSRAGGFHWQLV